MEGSTVVPVLKDHPITHKHMTSQDRWSLLKDSIGSILNPLAGNFLKIPERRVEARKQASDDWRSFYLSQYNWLKGSHMIKVVWLPNETDIHTANLWHQILPITQQCRTFCLDFGCFKTGSMSWQWSLKAGFTVTASLTSSVLLAKTRGISVMWISGQISSRQPDARLLL